MVGLFHCAICKHLPNQPLLQCDESQTWVHLHMYFLIKPHNFFPSRHSYECRWISKCEKMVLWQDNRWYRWQVLFDMQMGKPHLSFSAHIKLLIKTCHPHLSQWWQNLSTLEPRQSVKGTFRPHRMGCLNTLELETWRDTGFTLLYCIEGFPLTIPEWSFVVMTWFSHLNVVWTNMS